jgi:hypothetical protein
LPARKFLKFFPKGCSEADDNQVVGEQTEFRRLNLAQFLKEKHHGSD